tara:strand:+ start:2625 stop:4145 length:1521 start_codon:yes stop_codon:yes gene_type:complete
MPNFNANLNIRTGRGDALTASKNGSYVDVFNIRQTVNNTNASNTLLTGAKSVGVASISDAKSLIIKNNGEVPAEIVIATNTHTDATPDTTGAAAYQKYILSANDFMYLPNIRQMYGSSANSSASAYTLDNQVPDANMYVALNNAASGDAQLVAEAIDGSETEIDVDEGGYFFVGDLIRVENEIMEVTAISTNTLTVIRGTHGSSAASHSDDTAIRLPFFNNYVDFDKYSTAQTDSAGKYKATNLIGLCRNTDGSGNPESMGCNGLSIKFYSQGFQEIGLSGISSSTSSGLDVSTEYKFNITVDGGSTFSNLTFITDSSDVSFGGTNGIINKIQDALDTQFYTAGSNLFEKKVRVSIVNGDVRFTSGSHLSTSAILLAAPTSGTTPFGVGRLPAIANVEAPVASKLPQDTIIDSRTGLETKNINQMAYDDGHGVIKGVCDGTISYNSGAITLQNAPANANFVVSANYGSSQSGGNRFGAAMGNCITSISGRSCNSKIDTTIEIIGLR